MAKKPKRKQVATRSPLKRRASSRVARKKTAARATATRKRRRKPVPKPASKVSTAATAARGALAGAVTAVVKRLPWSSSEPDAIEMLEQEHRRFEALLAEGDATTDRAKKTRRELLATLSSALNEHELMEEKVLYPALQSHPEAREVVLEGYEEHHVADLIIKELQQVSTNDEQWRAKFKVLKENIEHHIEEEEGQMFPTARGIFSREELSDLAARMSALKPPGRRRRGGPAA